MLDVELKPLDELLIDNCIIHNMVIAGCEFIHSVVIKDSVFDVFNAIGAWFTKGLLIKGCIFKGRTTFEAGGHNDPDHKVIIENNIFISPLDFFDVWYKGPFVFRHNIVLAGSNLLGNQDTCTKAGFDSTVEIENNIGNLYLNEADMPSYP